MKRPSGRSALAWLHVHRPQWVDGVDYVDPEAPTRRSVNSETHPEAFLILNRHNAEILMTYVDEYRAALEATGGLPDDWTPDR